MTTYIAHNALPEPVPCYDNRTVFSEECAMRNLIKLVQQPRVVGSIANEQIAMNFLLGELKKLQDGLAPGFSMEIDAQNVSGSFSLAYRGFLSITNVYHDLHNVAVRIRYPANEKSSDAVMIATHVDSMLGSVGASDAGACVVSILEILNVLTKDPAYFRRPLIALFNGGEELGMQAAHGFVAKHTWSESIFSFINLDSGGVGGNSLLLQSGPGNSWMVGLYSTVSRAPHGSVIAQDVFQSGLVPSDTDFRVYTEHADTVIPGIEFVFYQNGYLYHTHGDTVENMDSGSLQHIGNSAFDMLKALIEHPDIGFHTLKDASSDSGVFYSFLDHFLFAYSKLAASMINSLVFSVSFVYILFMMSIQALNRTCLFVCVAYCLVTVLACILVSGLVGTVIEFVIRKPLSWFSNPLYAILLYGSATSLTAGVCGLIFLKSVKGLPKPIFHVKFALLFWWSLLLFGLTLFGLGSAYICLYWAMYFLHSCIFAHSLPSNSRSQDPIPKSSFQAIFWLMVELFPVIVPTVFSFTTMLLFIQFFIPAMGRLGPIPADVALGFCFPGLFLLTLNGFWPMILATRKVRIIIKTAGLLLILMVVRILFSSSGIHTYTIMTPKRVLIQHTVDEGKFALRKPPVREYVAGPSDLYFIGIDRIPMDTLARSSVAFAKFAVPVGKIPFHEFDCLYPLALSAVSSVAKAKENVPLPIFPPVVLSILNESSNGNLTQYVIQVNAPMCSYATVTLGILPKNIKGWSFEAPIPSKWDVAEGFLIRFLSSSDEIFNFSFSILTGTTGTIRFVATYLDIKTEAIEHAVNVLPDVVSPAVWTSVISKWTLE